MKPITYLCVGLACAGIVQAGAVLADAVPIATESTLQEDDPGWDCRGGNRVCGPASDDYGHAPGCYNDRGLLVEPWPCHIRVNSDGSSDVFVGLPVSVDFLPVWLEEIRPDTDVDPIAEQEWLIDTASDYPA